MNESAGSCIKRVMRVYIKKQKSHLNNSCIRWYLSEEKLWITSFKEYADVEESIKDSIGSFNWLYEVNDTVLFRKEDGGFETAIIDLSGKINFDAIDYSSRKECNIQKGNLFLAEKGNLSFEFPESINYVESKDYLISLPDKFDIEKLLILFIVDDFAFVIMENQLEGWILKNASKYICMPEMEENLCSSNSHLLGAYFKALKIWEEDNDTTLLNELLDAVKIKRDVVSMAVQECIMNILSDGL